MRARVASADYFDERRAGQVDLTQALRSPGSALKPFIYGLAFEDGLVHPETLIEDRPVRYGAYAPENFDMTFQGTVSARRALQLSLNVPAVALLEKVGASRLSARLAQAGAPLVLPKGEAPGLAMALGGVGVKLTDLTMLYAGLARGGMALPLVELMEDRVPSAPVRLIDPVAAWYVGNVLIGSPPPENAVGGRIAYKTGTSYGYRDAWSVGYDGRLTIGVWVGRPDGAPVPGLIGRVAAAPILFDAFARTGQPVAPLAGAPQGAMFATNAKLPPPLQRFRPGRLPGDSAEPSLRILYPPNGARIELAMSDGKPDPVALKIAGGVGPSDRDGERRSGRDAGRAAHAAGRSRWARFPPPHRDGRQRLDRQRDGAAAISSVCSISESSLRGRFVSFDEAIASSGRSGQCCWIIAPAPVRIGTLRKLFNLDPLTGSPERSAENIQDQLELLA